MADIEILVGRDRPMAGNLQGIDPALADDLKDLYRRNLASHPITQGDLFIARTDRIITELPLSTTDGAILVADEDSGLPTYVTTLVANYTFSGSVTLNGNVIIDSWAEGSIGYTDASSIFTELTLGTNVPPQVLGVNVAETAPQWQTAVVYLAHTLLDGAFHTDTTSAAPTIGDLIIANVAGPLWAPLPIGNVGAPLVVNPGGNQPQWVPLAPAGGQIVFFNGTETLFTTELTFVGTTLTVGVTATGTITADTGQTLIIQREDGFDWVTLSAGINASIALSTNLKDGVEWIYGSSDDSGMRWSNEQTDHALVIFTKVNSTNSSGAIIITADANRLVDHGYVFGPDPRLFIANTAAPMTDWISFHHDGDGQIITGAGNLNLTPAGIVVANALAVSDLTVGRIPFVGAAGRLVDSPNWLFDGVSQVTLTSSATAVLLFTINTLDAALQRAQHLIQVAGAASADPYTTYQIAGVQSWSIGIDNSAGDAFKISESILLGTNDRIIVLPGGLVGIAVAPRSTLDVAGSFAVQIDTFAVNTTLTTRHHTVKGDASGGAITFTLPSVGSVNRRVYRIKKIDSSPNAVTVAAAGFDLIDGALTQVITAQWDGIDVQSDGTTWSVH